METSTKDDEPNPRWETVVDLACPPDTIYAINSTHVCRVSSTGVNESVHSWFSAVGASTSSAPISADVFKKALKESYSPAIQAEINRPVFWGWGKPPVEDIVSVQQKTNEHLDDIVARFGKVPPPLQNHAWELFEAPGPMPKWRCGGSIITVFGHLGEDCDGCGEVVTMDEVDAAGWGVPELSAVKPYLDLVVAQRRKANMPA